jgi:uncharacterized protein (DUF2342 family)
MQTIPEMFRFLNALRRSGDTNMFGAAPWLMDYFSVDAKTAKHTLTLWMHWINENPHNGDK